MCRRFVLICLLFFSCSFCSNIEPIKYASCPSIELMKHTSCLLPLLSYLSTSTSHEVKLTLVLAVYKLNSRGSWSVVLISISAQWRVWSKLAL